MTYFKDDDWVLHHGDCVEVMAQMDAESVDAVVCDPPYGLAFMGRSWDDFEPLEYQRWCQQWGEAALRVAKPGAHLLAFGGTRTSHRLVCGLEDAGWTIRDTLVYMYGQGFPKSINPGRWQRKQLCPSHESVPHAVRCSRPFQVGSNEARTPTALALAQTLHEDEPVLLMGIGEGGGFNARMAISLSESTGGMSSNIASSWSDISGANSQAMSTFITETETGLTTESGIWTSLTSARMRRITTPDVTSPPGCECHAVPVARWSSDGELSTNGTHVFIATGRVTSKLSELDKLGSSLKPAHEPIVLARKPLDGTVADNVLAHGTGALNIDGCRIGMTEEDAESINAKHAGMDAEEYERRPGTSLNLSERPMDLRPARAHESGRWPANVVLDEEAARQLDDQAGECGSYLDRGVHQTDGYANEVYGHLPKDSTFSYGDSGGPSRFYYTAKAHSSEKPWESGDDTTHPTVKPLDLMRWLVRLVTPPGGLVLDPFAGTGTTAEACVIEGFRSVLIEAHEPYCELCVKRLTKPIQPTLS